jgi:type IV secretory pathway VirB2 component (pilin)
MFVHRIRSFAWVAWAWLVCAPAFAQLGGRNLPWEGPLETISQSMTGPVAKWSIMIAIVASALGLAFFNEGGGGIWRKALYVVLGGSIAFGVASIIALMGGS